VLGHLCREYPGGAVHGRDGGAHQRVQLRAERGVGQAKHIVDCRRALFGGQALDELLDRFGLRRLADDGKGAVTLLDTYVEYGRPGVETALLFEGADQHFYGVHDRSDSSSTTTLRA